LSFFVHCAGKRAHQTRLAIASGHVMPSGTL
jgi:hypothetical protein